MGDKTLNLHLTDRCNFRCKHCFVNMNQNELTLLECKTIINNVAKTKEYKRVNIAGGEPLMVTYIQEVIDYVILQGLECSIITNGSLLKKEFIVHNKEKLTTIGISVDSIDIETNKQIGRNTLTNLVELCQTIKENKIGLKINICISKLNSNQDFSELLDEIKPDRLKLLQLMPTKHKPDSYHMQVSHLEFESVCEKLKKYNPVCEDIEYLQNSYWIVDSEGYFGKDNLHKKADDKLNLLLK